MATIAHALGVSRAAPKNWHDYKTQTLFSRTHAAILSALASVRKMHDDVVWRRGK